MWSLRAPPTARPTSRAVVMVPFFVFFVCLALQVEGHGYIKIPAGRNWVANQRGLDYCPHCHSAGGPQVVKSYSPGGAFPQKETTATAGRRGECGDAINSPSPMYNPFVQYSGYTLPSYTQGGTIDITIVITAPHMGHYEFRLCPSGQLANQQNVTWGCLNSNVLQRVAIPGEVSTIDPTQPHRFYAPPTCLPGYTGTQVMRYRLPANVTCSRCILQWWWVTANSCVPPGYRQRPNWPAGTTCPWYMPIYPDCGSSAYPEEFWNCADIKIVAAGTQPTSPPPPPPTTPAPAPVLAPAVVAPASQACARMDEKCGGLGHTGPTCCLTGYSCFQFNDWLSQCKNTCPSGCACGTTCASGGARCGGGAGWTGPRCCTGTLTCCVKSATYSQCSQVCDPTWPTDGTPLAPAPAPLPPVPAAPKPAAPKAPTAPPAVPKAPPAVPKAPPAAPKAPTAPPATPKAPPAVPVAPPATPTAPKAPTVPGVSACPEYDNSNANKFNAENPVIGYVGGNTMTNWNWNDTKWQVYDMLIIAFVTRWDLPKASCGGSTLWTGLPGYPDLNTAACGWQGTMPCSQVLGCAAGTGMQGADGVRAFQNKGQRKVLISLGGAAANAVFGSAAEGTALANALWQLYLGGTDARYKPYRPFGDVILDGVDIDIEQAQDRSSSTTTGFGSFVQQMRILMDSDKRKQYYITAAPINPLYGPFWGGQEQYGVFPDVPQCWQIGATVPTPNVTNVSPVNSVMGQLDKLDYLFPQYYNTPEHNFCSGQSATSCTVPPQQCYRMHYRYWSAAIALYGKGYCKHVVGLPYGLTASNNGFVPAANLETMLKEILQSFPETVSVAGGVMGWELAADPNAVYVTQLKGVLDRLKALGLMGRPITPREKAVSATC